MGLPTRKRFTWPMVECDRYILSVAHQFHVVLHDRHLAPLADDLHRVPLTDRLVFRFLRRLHVVNAAGVLIVGQLARPTFVIDELNFHPLIRRVALDRRAERHAAVTALCVRWESPLHSQDVVRVLLLRGEVAIRLAGAVDEMCARMGVERQDIDRLCCHPGGVKVIDAIESALELNQGELNIEREVLRDFGNMSAPTVLFVLQRLIEQGLPRRVLMTAFGPGFTCAGLLLEAA